MSGLGDKQNSLGGQLRKLGMTFQQQLCQRPSAFIKTLSAGKYIQYAQYKHTHIGMYLHSETHMHKCMEKTEMLNAFAFEFDQSSISPLILYLDLFPSLLKRHLNLS